MSGPVAPRPGVAGIEDLRACGFEGFASVGQLRDEAAASVPVAPGAWIVVRESAAALPRFLPRSTASEWRGQDPTMSADALGVRWVPHACVLYVGVAPGTGVRHLLQQRVKRFLRFGDGRNVAHWSGRHVWQLASAASLRIAWKVTTPEGARGAADELLQVFQEHHGAQPFANEAGEADE